MIAWIVDGIVIGVASIALSLALGALGLPGGSTATPIGTPEPAVDWLVRSAIGVVIDLLYFTLLWTGGRRTVGMRLFRVRVLREDGAVLSARQAVLRWMALSLVWIVLSDAAGAVAPGTMDILVLFGWPLLLLASTARDADHQGLHDRFAGSLVISSRR